MDKVRVAVVGVAGIGQTHLKSYLQFPDLCEVRAVCDVVPEQAEQARALAGAQRAYRDYRDLLADPEIDAVSICTPHHLHRPIAIDAIQAGKHVLLEKPAALTFGEAAEIAYAQRASSVKVGVVFQSRFSPKLRFVHDEVAPRLGAVQFATVIECHWRGIEYFGKARWRGTWKQEGGSLFPNHAVHGWDLLQWLLGGVNFAYGYWTNLMHPYIEVEDIGYGFIEFRDGVYGKTVVTNCQQTPPITEGTPWRRRMPIHIIGERGEVIAADVNYGRVDADFRLEDKRLERDLKGAMEAADQGNPLRGHAANICDFLQAVQEDRSPYIDMESGSQTLKIIDGIHWHGWHHREDFRRWVYANFQLPRPRQPRFGPTADDAREQGWDGGEMMARLVAFVEDRAPRLEAPFLNSDSPASAPWR